jgi:hypothetical protein
MRTDNSTPRVQEQPEQFDELTGGYDMTDHNRAAARINADLRKMPQRVEGHTRWFAVQDSCGAWEVQDFSRMSVLRKVDGKQNATLAASAPDLLAACKRAMLAIDTGFLREPNWEEMTLEQKRDSRQQSVYNDLAAAIARATGGGQ